MKRNVKKDICDDFIISKVSTALARGPEFKSLASK